MSDIIEKIGKSLIQHGKSNDRVYLMKLSRDDYPRLIGQIDQLAKENNYSKIFIKIPGWAKEGFEKSGYIEEADIPKFYNGQEDAFFMAKYLNPRRGEKTNAELMEEIITVTKSIEPVQAFVLNENYTFGLLKPKDAHHMAMVYQKVFKTYPFPIHDPVYLVETMQHNIVYFGIWEKDKLIAVSSCEMDEDSQNVEMTDFATLPEYRAQGLASFLLAIMEAEMKKRGMITAYTIARAVSYGMNITFAKHGYLFSGTLINNTNISGEIESMNVWYKTL